MPLPEKRDPSHILTITVPLNLKDSCISEDEITQAFQQAVNALISVVKLGTLGLVADHMDVSIEDLSAAPTSPVEKLAKEAYWYKWAYDKLAVEPGNSVMIHRALREKLA